MRGSRCFGTVPPHSFGKPRRTQLQLKHAPASVNQRARIGDGNLVRRATVSSLRVALVDRSWALGCQPLSESTREFEIPSGSVPIPTPLFRLGVPTLTVANREHAEWPQVAQGGGLASFGRAPRLSTDPRAELPPSRGSGSPNPTGLRTRSKFANPYGPDPKGAPRTRRYFAKPYGVGPSQDGSANSGGLWLTGRGPGNRPARLPAPGPRSLEPRV